MYDNIGGKIKGLAKATFIVEAIAAVITGIVFIFDPYDEEDIIIGFILVILGPLVAWVSSWLLYGYGELIDKTCGIERDIHKERRKSYANIIADEKRLSKIEKLRMQELISEEEYQQIISKVQFGESI